LLPPTIAAVYKLSTSFASPEYGKRAVIEIFEDLLYRYPQHPEAKSLSFDRKPCEGETRGQLQRAHIIAGEHRRIGKESDRRWEEGDDLESLLFMPMEYEQPGNQGDRKGFARASEHLIRLIRDFGKRRLERFGLGRRILDKIDGRKLVKNTMLRLYEHKIKQYRAQEREGR
jgi:hypothetical protein